jgi:hypothetical protein
MSLASRYTQMDGYGKYHCTGEEAHPIQKIVVWVVLHR